MNELQTSLELLLADHDLEDVFSELANICKERCKDMDLDSRNQNLDSEDRAIAKESFLTYAKIRRHLNRAVDLAKDVFH